MSTIKARKWVGHVMAKVVLFAAALICVALMSAPLYSQPCEIDRDCWIPDSVYYAPFSYNLKSCAPRVQVRIPVFLWSDQASVLHGLRLTLSGTASVDTAFYFFLKPCSLQFVNGLISDNRDTVAAAWECLEHYITPAAGIDAEIVISCSKGDTVRIKEVPPWSFTLLDLEGEWHPSYMRLDTTFVVPIDLASTSGDVDCSGIVSISDAVFLIRYIFTGGCAPNDADAADVNGNCAISISDVVYLINYIFAGGNAPLPGCVVP